MVRSILIHLEQSIRPELWLKNAEAAFVKDGVVQVRVEDAPIIQVEMDAIKHQDRNRL